MAKPYERRTRFYPDPRRPFERMISLVTPLKRDQLEAYEDNLIWEIIRGAAVYHVDNNVVNYAICFPTSYLNKGVETYIGDCGWVVGRSQGAGNYYRANTYIDAPTLDFKLAKIVADVTTILGEESVDIAAGTLWKVKLEIKDSTLKAYREDMITPKITATDTTFTTEGKWGCGGTGVYKSEFLKLVSIASCKLVEPASPSLKVLRYYEVPIIGEGTEENPFRPQLPEEIVDHPRFGKVNRLAISWGGIIPTDQKTGKPKDYVALVEIFDQPIRQDHLYPIPQCLSALEAISGVKRLREDIFERRKKRLLEI